MLNNHKPYLYCGAIQRHFLVFAVHENIFPHFPESCTSVHEESITCPLEVSELEPLENELSDIDNKNPVSVKC